MKKDIKKLANDLRKELKEDILLRYDSAEYWEIQIAEDFYTNTQLTEKEIEEVNEILGL